jgi:dTDP-4-amino-4,6-dideoxygalactose transaminase
MTPSKKNIQDLAVFGGLPVFENPLHVGQLYMPDWEDFKKSFHGIFQRRYFANNGPLVREMDELFADHLGVRNAVCVTNGTVALMVATKALDLKGEVIVPAFTFPATVQSLYWAGLKPVFCDINPHTHNINAELAEPLINEQTCAILGVHLWGRACDPQGLQSLCDKHGLTLYFDAAHAIDCTCRGKKIGGFGWVESFSFHATKVVNGAEGGCLTTNDDELAGRIRTARNFHISETYSRVPLRINGKMSEAQAAMALLGLKGLPRNIKNNKMLYAIYRRRSAEWKGLRMVDTVGEEESNYQYCVFEVNPEATALTRDQLFSLLRAEKVLARRYFYPGVHRMKPYDSLFPEYHDTLPETDHLSAHLLQLPIGASVSSHQIEQISDLISCLLKHDAEIANYMSQKGTIV